MTTKLGLLSPVLQINRGKIKKGKIKMMSTRTVKKNLMRNPPDGTKSVMNECLYKGS